MENNIHKLNVHKWTSQYDFLCTLVDYMISFPSPMAFEFYKNGLMYMWLNYVRYNHKITWNYVAYQKRDFFNL
jgi:hypothetical protein